MDHRVLDLPEGPAVTVLAVVNLVLVVALALALGPLRRDKSEPLLLRTPIDLPEQVVSRALVDATWDSATLEPRIVPSLSNGRPDGLRIYAVRPGSLAFAVRLRNGDRVTRVAGVDLSSPDRCIEAYQKLRTPERFSVEIVRQGVPLRLWYRLVL